MSIQRMRVEITGKVQGVGFRPAVYRYAAWHDLAGWVSNGPEGVTIEAQGEMRRLVEFVDCLRHGMPAASEVRSFNVHPMNPEPQVKTFQIVPSRVAGTDAKALVPPDMAICDDCRAEIQNPADRRFLHPFTNCTICGPRFSIVKTLPYDRPATTMRDFAMCPKCRAEYENPPDRRFHAQPNACPDCGPRVWWSAGQSGADGGPAVSAAAAFLKIGKIVAIQSLGGFHLACDARRKDVVELLRSRKRRPHKPLAVMAPTLDAARRWARISAKAKELLTSSAAPVVMLASRAPELAWLAPGLDRIGLMIAYTPLHIALFHELAAAGGPNILVMTSGNPPGEPICREPEKALVKLSGIADGFLSHDRRIHNRCDDSVVTVRGGRSHMIRRARGYVPEPVYLPQSSPSIFAAGSDLKNAACVTRGDESFLTQYIGDLTHLENERFYVEAVDRLCRFLNVQPRLVAHDLHPDMVSTRKALEIAAANGIPDSNMIRVQHHHAHIAATMAEHRLSGTVIGVALDGFGFGTDGTIWGGEFLKVDETGFERLGHLVPVAQPGGDRATVEIWRMAVSWLIAAFGPEEAMKVGRQVLPEISTDLIEQVGRLSLRPGLTLTTSSAGRLFDAMAVIAGIRTEVTFEGQAAMELEAACADRFDGEYEFRIRETLGALLLDPRPVVRAAVMDRRHGESAAAVAVRFHRGFAHAIGDACVKIAASTGLNRVAAGGGVFQNMRLLDDVERNLLDAGLEFYAPERIPANDGGIAIGQAWIASNRFAEGRP